MFLFYFRLKNKLKNVGLRDIRTLFYDIIDEWWSPTRVMVCWIFDYLAWIGPNVPVKRRPMALSRYSKGANWQRQGGKRSIVVRVVCILSLPVETECRSQIRILNFRSLIVMPAYSAYCVGDSISRFGFDEKRWCHLYLNLYYNMNRMKTVKVKKMHPNLLNNWWHSVLILARFVNVLDEECCYVVVENISQHLLSFFQ